ncbi:hypothetical protein JK185_15205 [Gluconobacter wancherniae]|uniref:hypothetical protein n=1 Tax=Gluconobacter wancherniae TaxID=1307955 RepID=UPI001B8B49E0|nr:hypothetical protein [Gluconobacter wancherniae]MBS1064329.1 hypothetical protein [Gluconobacter wancherniae]
MKLLSPHNQNHNPWALAVVGRQSHDPDFVKMLDSARSTALATRSARILRPEF